LNHFPVTDISRAVELSEYHTVFAGGSSHVPKLIIINAEIFTIAFIGPLNANSNENPMSFVRAKKIDTIIDTITLIKLLLGHYTSQIENR
jgi:hypothetical protein